jgi:site-specific recombinase XerD
VSVLRDAEEGLMRAGYTPETVAVVVKHVRRFARETGTVSPWVVTGEVFTGWADSLSVSVRAGYAYRTSLRTFYRWAHRAGLCLSDPTAGTSRRVRPLAVPQTWGEAIRGYMDWLRITAATRATIEHRRHQLTRVSRELDRFGPWDVTTSDLADWMASKGWSAETVRAHRAALRTFYAWAVTVGYVEENPAAALPRVRIRSTAARPAPEDAIRWALTATDPAVRLMVRLAAELGLRRSEVACIHSRDVATGTDGLDWLTVHGKGLRERVLPLPADLARVIRSANGYLFPGQDDGHVSPWWVGKQVSAALPEGVTMHQLRHRFATQAYAIDQDVLTVQQLLGHASPVTTQRYVQVPAASLRRLVNMVGGRLNDGDESTRRRSTGDASASPGRDASAIAGIRIGDA